ncbi:MAG: hypothetical protein AB1609_16365 [Bacillota bacterium]
MPGCCTLPDSNEKVSVVPAPTNREGERCPSCGAKGKHVERLTVKAMLAVSLRRLGAQRYRFCRTPACPVVYFAEDADEQFTVDEVRERVFQKEPEADDVFVCYCFRHTRGALRQAAPPDHARIVEEIEAGIQAGQCACELRNPQGSCCLGNVRAVTNRATAQ